MSKKWHKTKVVRGLGKGRELGFPTANLVVPEHFDLKYGIYATHVCFARPSAKDVPSIASQILRVRRGLRPACGACDPLLLDGLTCFHGVLYWGTRGGGTPSLEIHIFDFEGDLYDKKLQFQVGQFIRADRRFNSPNQLVKQMRLDVAQARKMG